MATPAVYTFKEKTVKLVATNVTTGNINKHRLYGRNKTYLATTRPTGNAAPSVSQILNEGYIMFKDHPEQENIESTDGIDIYIYCNLENTTDNEYGKLVVWV